MEPITKKRLQNYIFLKMENDNKLEHLARLRSREHFPEYKESDGSKHQAGASDRVANALIKRLEYQEKIADRIEENQREMDLIEQAIDRLADPMERTVLELRYLDCEDGCRHRKWEDVAMLVYGDDGENQLRAVHRIHKRALENIREIEL